VLVKNVLAVSTKEQLRGAIVQCVKLAGSHHFDGSRSWQIDVDYFFYTPGSSAHYGNLVAEKNRFADSVGNHECGRWFLGPDAQKLKVQPLSSHVI
jgi:hypothetical protein